MPYFPPTTDPTKLPLAGGTMTGTITSTIGTITASTPALSATQTWNNAATTFYGLLINVTPTASASASSIFDIQRSGATRLRMDNVGDVHFGASVYSANYYENGGFAFALSGNFNGLSLGSARYVSWCSGTAANGTRDTGLYRNAAGVIEANNGTAGTYRDLKLRTLISEAGTITASTPALTATQTWNDGAVTFKGLFLNVTNTASAAASRLFDFQSGGTTRLNLTAAGLLTLIGTGSSGSANVFGAGGANGNAMLIRDDGLLTVDTTLGLVSLLSGAQFLDVGLKFGTGAGLSFSNDINYYGTKDTGLKRNAAGVLEVNSGTAGTYRDLKLREVFATGAVRSNSPTSGVGYSTGAGGAVTQLTNKSTGVTLNTATGQITMHNAALAAAAVVTFTLTDSAIAAGDILLLNHISGGTPGPYLLNAQTAAGSATINVRNTSAGSLAEAIVLAFAIIKGVTS